VLFILFLALSLKFESTIFLYIASALPVLFVPLLPDFGSNQYIKPGKHSGKVELVRTAEGPGLLMIRFRPGYLRWNKKWLFFSLQDVSPYSTLPIPDDRIASLSALRHDLKRHPRKKDWVGVRIQHMKQRTQHLSYTLNEINRIVIHMEDVQELLAPKARSAASSKSLQA
jgi:hypothetical protein